MSSIRAGLVSSSVAAMNVVTFNGKQAPATFSAVNYNDVSNLVIHQGDTTTPSPGRHSQPARPSPRTADKTGILTINTPLNGADIFNEYVRVRAFHPRQRRPPLPR